MRTNPDNADHPRTTFCGECHTIDGCVCPVAPKANRRPRRYVDEFNTTQDAMDGWTAAVRLAQALHRLHYGPITTWRPLPTIAGVISQIDNLTAGLVRPFVPACTCHPDDRPVGDCPRQHAASDCLKVRHPVERPDRFANDAAAKKLYDTWSNKPGWVPWVERGNSLMQERARREVLV